jgi:hypothetical protein
MLFNAKKHVLLLVDPLHPLQHFLKNVNLFDPILLEHVEQFDVVL